MKSFENRSDRCPQTAPTSNKKKSEEKSYPLSYANALTKSKESIIIVKPSEKNVTGEDSTNIKEVIKQKINPDGLGVDINSKKNNRDEAVLRKVCDGEEAQRLQKDIEREMGKSVNTKIPEKKNPCIKIVGLEKNYEEKELIDILKSQNNTVITAESHLTVKVTKKMVENYLSIIECDPDTFQKIMLKSGSRLYIGCRACKVFEYISVLRCYNCCQYGHTAADCKSEKMCGKCNSTFHEHRDCEKKMECTNCCMSNNDFNSKHDINHSSFDFMCPVYISVTNKAKANIYYQQ
ncbi:unnamed protein product [Ceutorhynchus assimilis]|uniref:CCHC-type domain-containing protein n=1 Tax=Ceutorhynchus assimilis TaxID=467358 RepID=A0A9N9QEE9_9CUCU|nr:unnamed protein product [Ceutorhynchus assimilis]